MATTWADIGHRVFSWRYFFLSKYR